MFKRSLFLAAACCLAAAGADARPRAVAAAPAQASASYGHAAAALISAYRARYGLGPVVLDPRLTQAAVYQARANAASGTLSHDVGGAFSQRMAAAGIGRGYKAENLGAGSLSLEQVVAMWQASPQHSSNMLQPGFRRIGIAHAEAPGSMYGRFWALELAD